MTKQEEIKALVKSYPDNYSCREIASTIWAETGIIVSEASVREIKAEQ